jgi:hypothetical protein
MKKLFFAIVIACTSLLSSCGVNYAMIVNHNQNLTQVQLASNNFKVVDRVSGRSEVKYVVMIGGLKKRQLYEEAYTEMITKANLLNSSKAIINVITEEHFNFVTPFFIRRTVTVSGNVIEFNR